VVLPDEPDVVKAEGGAAGQHERSAAVRVAGFVEKRQLANAESAERAESEEREARANTRINSHSNK
jgi:hypothetical protein